MVTYHTPNSPNINLLLNTTCIVSAMNEEASQDILGLKGAIEEQGIVYPGNQRCRRLEEGHAESILKFLPRPDLKTGGCLP